MTTHLKRDITFNDNLHRAALADANGSEAAYYGNLARVAIAYYLSNGNPAEQHAAYWYARYAVRAVQA